MAKPSLATQVAVKSNDPMAILPAMPSATESISIVEDAGGNTPFLNFAHPMSAKYWPKLTSTFKQVVENDPYLIFPDPQPPIHCNPLRYFLVSAHQYWAHKTDVGDWVRGSSIRLHNNNDLVERIESLICVLSSEGLIPCNASFKTTKTGCVKKSQTYLKEASSEKWATYSDAHKNTLQIRDPRFRFVTTVRMQKNIAKTPPNRPYFTAEATCSPTSAEEYNEIMKFFGDESKAKQFTDVVEVYSRRIEKIKTNIAADEAKTW